MHRCLAACLKTRLKLLRFPLCKGMSCKEALRCFSSGAVHVTAMFCTCLMQMLVH